MGRGAISLNEILACPVCKGDLEGERCSGCGRAYRRLGEVLDLTPLPPPDTEVRERWPLWEKLQANGEHAYDFDPPSSLSVGEREDAGAFAKFADLRGRVLDVGCGPQEMPSYAAAFDGELVGIDPLLGVQPRDFEFVKGIAEYLPFRDGSFDHVLFATSLDHLLDRRRALAEARRVLRPGGRVHIWIGVPDAPSRGALGKVADAVYLARHGRLRELFSQSSVEPDEKAPEYAVPEGAIDAFHVEHPTAEQVREGFESVGLTLVAEDSAIPGRRFLSGSPAASSQG